jgi:hypothetical protein
VSWLNALVSVGRRSTGFLIATQIPECSMTVATMFASGNAAHVSMFNRGSEGSVTDEKGETNIRTKSLSNSSGAVSPE